MMGAQWGGGAAGGGGGAKKSAEELMFAFIHRSYLAGPEGTTDTNETKHHRGEMDKERGTGERGREMGDRQNGSGRGGKLCESFREEN